jgi:predicted ester cyclase
VEAAVDELTPQRLADDYVAWAATGDPTMLQWFAPDFLDHVSGRTGPDIWDVVAGWMAESFADLSVDLHAVMSDGDRVMVWVTMHGRHVGSAFPRLRGLPALGNRITWAQVHVFRVVAGRVTEHWAVRDDAALLDQAQATI